MIKAPATIATGLNRKPGRLGKSHNRRVLIQQAILHQALVSI
jgi:hypothetical protein